MAARRLKLKRKLLLYPQPRKRKRLLHLLEHRPSTNQSSRKGEKAWRRKKNIDDVEGHLEGIRDEERMFGKALREKKNEEFFMNDTKGDETRLSIASLVLPRLTLSPYNRQIPPQILSHLSFLTLKPFATFRRPRRLFTPIINIRQAKVLAHALGERPMTVNWQKGKEGSSQQFPLMEVSEAVRKVGSMMFKRHWLLCIYAVLLMTGFNFLPHGSQDLYPTCLALTKGFDNYHSTVATIIGNCGAIAGGVIAGWLSQYLGRRLTIVSFVLLIGAFIPLWIIPNSFGGLSAGAFWVEFGVQGAWGVIPIQLAEMSPRAFCATFPGAAYQLGNMPVGQRRNRTTGPSSVLKTTVRMCLMPGNGARGNKSTCRKPISSLLNEVCFSPAPTSREAPQSIRGLQQSVNNEMDGFAPY
ncbi:hypothetical protein EW146_g7994 [Bondarzewia mesenterica]|uniref:Ribosome biogenesis protein NOP53 n=1 Tax=Bondarzewia mesenterica TaxID=1095465 RepID=A0A4S4LHV8_9AGAM|nr:hypothetical protein EW146_g7994 [Bondarzewia mesenterica]